MRYDIDGAAARDDVTWTCPACGRVHHDDGDTRVVGRSCAGHPITGAPHPATPMVRSPAASRSDIVRATSTPSGVTLTWDQPGSDPVADINTWLERARDAYLTASAGDGWCGYCGALVEVDNPLRREVRHRRGCPAAGS